MCLHVFACVCMCSHVFACVCMCLHVFACVCMCSLQSSVPVSNGPALQNVSSYYRMCPLTTECVLLLQNVSSYYRMCPLTTECVLCSLACLSAMVQLEIPHVNVISKLDLVLRLGSRISGLQISCSGFRASGLGFGRVGFRVWEGRIQLDC